jgi:hypothetical protein
MNELTTEYSAVPNLNQTVLRLRSRAWLLRIQAYVGIGLIIALVITLIVGFTNLQKDSSSSPKLQDRPREPYDYRLMEARHNAISDKLSEVIDSLGATKQEAIYDRYGNGGKQQKAILESLEARNDELRKIKTDIDDRLSKDRQNMLLELSKLREERDHAIREGGERFMLLQLLGNVAFRLGVLILAVYLISIISNISKYLLRVADHLNSTADSIDLLRASQLSVERGISSLTPHPIDFQIDDTLSVRSIKELVGFLGANSKKNKDSEP